jgi:hypothetical protein
MPTYTTAGHTDKPHARARLYLDGVAVTNPADYVPFDTGDFTFWDSTSYPAVGAEPNSNAAADDFFEGDVNAAVVYNYQVDHNVLAVSPPWDGDMLYGGQPSYWDYLVPTETAPTTSSYGTWSYAHHFTNSERNGAWSADINTERARVPIPLVSANYVPQGLAISEDGTTMYQLFYYSTEDPTNQNPQGGLCGNPCPAYALTATDLNTQRVTAIYELGDPALPNAMLGSHAGGLVATHGYLYAGGLYDGAGQKIFRLKLSEANLVAAGDTTLGLPPIYSLTVNYTYDWTAAGGTDASTSAMAYSPTTQSIYTLGYYEAGDNQAANKIYQFPVNASGEVATAPSATFQLSTSPATTFGYNQGLTPVPTTGGGQCFLVAHENKPASPNNSQIIRACFNSDGSGGTWSAPKKTLPGTVENLAVGPDSTVWLLNENPARRHQRRATDKWYRTFTPYVAGFPLSVFN